MYLYPVDGRESFFRPQHFRCRLDMQIMHTMRRNSIAIKKHPMATAILGKRFLLKINFNSLYKHGRRASAKIHMDERGVVSSKMSRIRNNSLSSSSSSSQSPAYKKITPLHLPHNFIR